MKYYYASGNFGSGSIIVAFQSKTERDNFYRSGDDKYCSLKKKHTRKTARASAKEALVLGETEKNGTEKWIKL